MRTPLTLLLSCLLLGVLLPGTAHAARYPVGSAPALTDNFLYKTGRLETTNCRTTPPKAGNVTSVKRYLLSVGKCLDTTWSAQFAKTGKPFTPPRIQILTEPHSYCGKPWTGSLLSDYCPQDGTIVFLITEPILKKPSKLSAFIAISHEYGHHVQRLSGIQDAYTRLPRRNAKERYEQARRHDLQAECLGAAFTRSVWESLKRPRGDWNALRANTARGGDDYWETHEYGKGRSIVHWMDSGFAAASPGDCDTWSASASAVA
ncbi:neutral zinc metallopeptidase [Streptosporangium sp. NPDC051023]|uniref:neutral zinc metallopeptidase n=1 Tax=Streptosporangium sp. NPDC051023 TaxID=3155410 RepID=UPI00344BBB76